MVMLRILCLIAFAQKSNHFVIAAQGSSDQSATLSLDWTIGEVVTETVQYGNEIFTQGFHQPVLMVKERLIERSSGNIDLPELIAKVYPNPFVSEVTLDIRNDGVSASLYSRFPCTIWNYLISQEKHYGREKAHFQDKRLI